MNDDRNAGYRHARASVARSRPIEVKAVPLRPSPWDRLSGAAERVEQLGMSIGWEPPVENIPSHRPATSAMMSDYGEVPKSATEVYADLPPTQTRARQPRIAYSASSEDRSCSWVDRFGYTWRPVGVNFWQKPGSSYSRMTWRPLVQGAGPLTEILRQPRVANALSFEDRSCNWIDSRGYLWCPIKHGGDPMWLSGALGLRLWWRELVRLQGPLTEMLRSE